jgi:cytochrome c556
MPVHVLSLIEQTGFFSQIRTSAYAYPAILSLHIVALALFGGTVLATDLRLLGFGMRSYSVSDVIAGLRAPKRIGFLLAAACGVLLFGAKAGRYSVNPWFWSKLALLAMIGVNYLVFRGRVYNNAAELDRSAKLPGSAKLAGGVSLLLWAGVICAARGPATIKDIMHSMVDPNGDFMFKSMQQIADANGIREKAPHTDAEWEDVREHLQVLMQAPDLLTAEGRMAAHPKDRSANPEVENEPEEVQKLLDADRANFLRRARRLHDAAAVSMKAADAKDQDALFRSLDGIDKACENCHLHYWYPRDRRAQEAAKEDGLTDY